MVNPGGRVDGQTDGWTDRWTDRQMDGNMDGGQTSGNSPCVVQEIGPLGPLSKKLEKKQRGVLQLLRTVEMDGWMDGDGWTLMGQFVVGEGQFEA